MSDSRYVQSVYILSNVGNLIKAIFAQPEQRAPEGRPSRSSSNMFAADVRCSCYWTRPAADPPLFPGSEEMKAKKHGRAFRLARAKSHSKAKRQQHPAPNYSTPLITHIGYLRLGKLRNRSATTAGEPDRWTVGAHGSVGLVGLNCGLLHTNSRFK